MTTNERRKKLRLGLECCIKRDPDDTPRCDECPYDGACANEMKKDELRLVTEMDDYDQKQHSGLLEE